MMHLKYQRAMLIANAILVGATPIRAQDPPPPWRNAANPAAVKSSEKPVANAAWWGHNDEDATDAVQAAIDSGAPRVIIPFDGKPWIVRPIKLRSNLELLLEPGVLLLAKRGEFRGKNDSLLSITDAENVTIRGYGATLRMWKRDYQREPYEKAEWRMGIRMHGARNVLIEGLRIESSGGDGVYISGTKNLPWSEDVVIRDVVCDDHHRQGISVISAENLLIENCILSNTRGTAPQAGIDFEPNHPHERLKNCVVRNSVMENNAGNQILVYVKPLDATSEEVSIRFENCHVREGSPGQTRAELADRPGFGAAGMCVGAATDNGPKGTITFEGCTSENTGQAGARIYDLSADSVRVEFIRTTWAHPWADPARDAESTAPAVVIHARRPELVTRTGGILFEDCAVITDVARPAIAFEDSGETDGLFDVTGAIYYRGPGAPEANLGEKLGNVTLAVLPADRE